MGNLLLLLGSEAFNTYAYTLHSLGHGALVPIAEVGLVILFAAHAASGISVGRMDLMVGTGVRLPTNPSTWRTDIRNVVES